MRSQSPEPPWCRVKASTFVKDESSTVTLCSTREKNLLWEVCKNIEVIQVGHKFLHYWFLVFCLFYFFSGNGNQPSHSYQKTCCFQTKNDVPLLSKNDMDTCETKCRFLKKALSCVFWNQGWEKRSWRSIRYTWWKMEMHPWLLQEQSWDHFTVCENYKKLQYYDWSLDCSWSNQGSFILSPSIIIDVTRFQRVQRGREMS